MPAVHRYKFPVRPGNTERQPTSVRGAYLQNLVDCVHICILRGLYDKARRAWAILVSLSSTIPTPDMSSLIGLVADIRYVAQTLTGSNDGDGVSSSSRAMPRAGSLPQRVASRCHGAAKIAQQTT